jgi:hypothetical protein
LPSKQEALNSNANMTKTKTNNEWGVVHGIKNKMFQMHDV